MPYLETFGPLYFWKTAWLNEILKARWQCEIYQIYTKKNEKVKFAQSIVHARQIVIVDTFFFLFSRDMTNFFRYINFFRLCVVNWREFLATLWITTRVQRESHKEVKSRTCDDIKSTLKIFFFVKTDEYRYDSSNVPWALTHVENTRRIQNFS